MSHVSFKLPDKLEEKLSRAVEEKGFQNQSEYIRTALREKLE